MAAMRVKSGGVSVFPHHGFLCDSQATGANLRMYSRSCPPFPRPWLRLDLSARIGIAMMGTMMARAKEEMVVMRSHRGPHAPCLEKDEMELPGSRFGD